MVGPHADVHNHIHNGGRRKNILTILSLLQGITNILYNTQVTTLQIDIIINFRPGTFPGGGPIMDNQVGHSINASFYKHSNSKLSLTCIVSIFWRTKMLNINIFKI